MPKKITKPIESKRAMELRHVERLASAYDETFTTKYYDIARHEYSLIRAAVYGVVPGKQKNKNIAALMELAVKSAARRIYAIKRGK